MTIDTLTTDAERVAAVGDLITKLQEIDASLGEPRDVLMTARALDEFHQKKRELCVLISGLQNPDIERPTAWLADFEARRTAAVAKGAELTEALASIPDLPSISHAVERARAYGARQHLERQLSLLRAGRLLRGPDCSYEPIAYLDTRIKELTERRDRAQRAFDAHVEQAQALLTEPTQISG